MVSKNDPLRQKTWRERTIQKYGIGTYMPYQADAIIPKWLLECIAFFFITMFACWVIFGHVPNWNLVFVAGVSVSLFFYAGYALSRNWHKVSEKRFLKNIFNFGFFVRMVWVAYIYYVFNPSYFGDVVGAKGDIEWYMPFAKDIAAWITGSSYLTLSQVFEYNMSAIDDVGYPMILAIEYVLTFGVSDVFVPMVVKSIMGACCAIMIYHVAKRHFGVSTARIAALFICLNPNMIYWCGSMMKEAEMVFFCCLAVDKLDQGLSSGNKLTLRALWPGLLAGLILFFMRTVLGLALFMGVLAHVVLASNKIISLAKKIIVGILVVTTLFIGVGNRLIEQSKEYLEEIQSDAQRINMEMRSNRDGGNSFAKYASASVFAPLIFTIPFPTLNVANEWQLTQVQLAGGNYIKNLFSFFVITVLFLMLISGDWRRHVFILAYTCGYLVVLVFSGYAQSGRFHMPIWPMLMLFAAYGVQVAKGNKYIRNGFHQVVLLEVLACLAWNWFKLAGRGLI
ncbi:MAG: hypothetical protein E7075_02955 [Bacteroidales bacterium]|nr:hypothetical protein [Bacteroidales bacterium]